MIQDFYDSLCALTYDKEIVTVKKSVNELLSHGQQYKTANELGINRLTLRLASTVGQPISMKVAHDICAYFKVPLEKYFHVEKQKVLYSSAYISGIRAILVSILADAKKNGLIEHNYASREFTKTIKTDARIKHEKEIFDENEVKEFVKAVLNETHIKRKTLFSLLVFLGLRKSEACALEWKDFDFANKTISIRRGSLYYKRFGGIITRNKTKSKTSKRTITMPDKLVEIVLEYNAWWNNQKTIMGDLWDSTDRLFLQDNYDNNNKVKPMHPCTVGNWLRIFQAKQGFKHIPPHALRHTCITNMLNAGVALKVVSQRAGHANTRITLDIYTHSTKSQDEQGAEVYNNFLCG